MAKSNKIQPREVKVQKPEEPRMSLQEARARRASLHKPQPKPLSESQRREAFRVFWASNKAMYGRAKTLEKALWLHLKSIGMTSPEQFADGLQNFGLERVK